MRGAAIARRCYIFAETPPMQRLASTARVEEPARPAPRFDAERVLVIRLGALGDVVRTRFAFEGVRALWPDASIDWLVDDGAAAALDGIVGLREVLRVPRSAL